MQLADLSYQKKPRIFAGVANRFAWDAAPDAVRRRSGFRVNGVLAVRRQGPQHLARTTVLSLLSLGFTAKGDADDPAGTLLFTFAGGHSLALDVECIDMQLDDLGPQWQAAAIPNHGEA